MDADQKQQSSSIIKQSKQKLIIKFRTRNINQQQQQCSSSKEAEVVVVKNMSVRKSISNNSDSSLSTTCSICGKSFPSKQSLFGHMRSHPDREYRGIQPPPPPPPPPSLPLPPSSPVQSQSLKFLIENSSPSSTDSDDSCKSAESYQGVGPVPVKWSSTGKRGRGRGRQPYGSFVSSSDERLADAIKGLLMLKDGNDLDVAAAAALMNKQISREIEGIRTSKKRIESLLSEEERSSKKIKIDEERSFSQLEQQLPSKEDCGLVNNSLKKLKLADERIGCSSSSSMFDLKLINSIMPSSSHEQFPHGDDFSLVENASKKVKLIPSSSNIPSTSSSHVPHMPQNGSHNISSSSSSSHVPPHSSIPSGSSSSHVPPHSSIPSGSSSSHVPLHSSIPSSSSSIHVPPHSSIPSGSSRSHVPLHSSVPSSSSSYGIPHMPLPNRYSQMPPFGGEFNSGFIKPSILKATTTNKKKVGSSAAAVGADQDMGLHRSSSTTEFKCYTCNRKFPTPQALGGHKSSPSNCKNNSNYQQFPSHDHQYLLCRESMIQAAADHEHPKIPTTSYGTHKCELCGETFATGQALGGHKRRHYTGYSTGTAPAPAPAPIEKLIKKEMVNSLSVVAAATAAASSSEVISSTTTTSTTTTTKTENKPPRVLDFDLNELPDESW